MIQACRQVTTVRKLFSIIVASITICLVAFSCQLSANQWQLVTAAPPDDVLRGSPDPDGLVQVMIGTNGKPYVKPITVTLNPFWTADGSLFNVELLDAQDKTSIESIILDPAQPIVLRAQGVPNGQLVWGSLSAKNDDEDITLPLVLGNFGPSIMLGPEDTGSKAVSIPATGQGRLRVDMSQHQAFGSDVHFTLTPFRSSRHTAEVKFAQTEEDEESMERELILSKGHNILDIAINASSLLPVDMYHGALQTMIGNHVFIETPLTLVRKKWEFNATYAQIIQARGNNAARLILATANQQPIFGMTVSAINEPTVDFDPRNDLDVILKRGTESLSLWTLDSMDADQINKRSLQPGSQHEVLVSTKRELKTGTYATTLRFGALNVNPQNWPEATVTFVVKDHPAYAILILVAAVIVSYMTSKGLATALRRRNLRLRVAKMRSTSWLRNDRWGALPIVRAFGRIALADRALQHKHGIKWLARVVTTPDLIANEITEVEKRLPVLERLSNLAIYWKAAPSGSGVQVRGVDPMIVRRAQKILQGIVDHLSQLREGEDVGTAFISEIEALESWSQREHMVAGYWTSLRSDIQLLLDSVQADEFDFDQTALQQLENELNIALCHVSGPDVEQALTSALAVISEVPEKGTQRVYKLLDQVLARVSNADKIEQQLSKLETSEREVVRQLKHTINVPDVPGMPNDMIRLEEKYAYLKLVWEQRADQNRRRRLFDMIKQDQPVENAFKLLDDEVWNRLKQDDAVRIVPPDKHKEIEEYELVDFEIECTDPHANTYLFKHGLEYEWCINFGGTRPLTPVTRATMVTQFIPKVTDVNISVTMKYRNNEMHTVNAVKTFKTVETTRFKYLWPVPTTELIGIGISFLLALIAGFQSDAFSSALAGSWKEYLALFAWGVGADQTRNLLQNLDTLTKGEDAPVK